MQGYCSKIFFLTFGNSYPHSIWSTVSIDVTNEKHLIEYYRFFADFAYP